MSATVIVAMVAADMACQQPLHELAKCHVRGRLQDQMKMIRHQTKREDLYAVAGLGCRKQLQEGFMVFSLVKNLSAGIAAVNHMLSITGRLTPRDSWHGFLVA